MITVAGRLWQFQLDSGIQIINWVVVAPAITSTILLTIVQMGQTSYPTPSSKSYCEWGTVKLISGVDRVVVSRNWVVACSC